jgi:hypothetical protein
MRIFLRSEGRIVTALLSGLLMMSFTVYPALSQQKTAAEKLQSAHSLSVEAVKIAAGVRENCDCEFLQKALGSVREAAVLVSEVAAAAESRGSMDLAQQAYDMVTNVVGAAFAFTRETCTYCPQTSMELETVGCFERHCSKAEEIDRLINETIEAALAAGAVPGPPEPFVAPEAPGKDAPVEDEPPIQDHEQAPASPS